MKVSKLFVNAALFSGLVFTTQVSAQGDDYGNRQNMPQGYSQGNMMNPMMMRMCQQGNNMPVMKMMQEKQAVMQQHRRVMENRLANIEALLQQLVDLQQAR